MQISDDNLMEARPVVGRRLEGLLFGDNNLINSGVPETGFDDDFVVSAQSENARLRVHQENIDAVNNSEEGDPSTTVAMSSQEKLQDNSTDGTEMTEKSKTTTTGTTEENSTTPGTKQVTKKLKVNIKNDATKFEGRGMNFRAKLIGVDDIEEARGDKLCQEKILRLKVSVKMSGQHKQRILINVSMEGLKIIDEKSGDVNYTHPVHRISFISRDTTDNRAFGYIYASGDGSHKFFAIKTANSAENLVLALRDLFQVVYDLKKKEMEEAKKKQAEEIKEPQKITLQLENDGGLSGSSTDDPIYSVPKNNAPVKEEHKKENEEGLANLLNLENELESIGQGIDIMNQLELSNDQTDSSDPWGEKSAEKVTPVTGKSSTEELEDIFAPPPDATQAQEQSTKVQLTSENLSKLYQSSQQQPSPFGQPMPGAFGAQSQPAPFPAQQPNPFQASPAFGAQPSFAPQQQAGFSNPFGGAPPVPARQATPGTAPFGGAPATQNPFQPSQSPIFFTAPGVNPGMNVQAASTVQTPTPFDAPLLTPMRNETEQETPTTTSAPSFSDPFGDLCDIGGKDATKAPKDLFAELNAPSKKSLAEIKSEVTPTPPNSGTVQASDPFGSLNTDSFPVLTSNPSTDPFDTSYLHTKGLMLQGHPAELPPKPGISGLNVSSHSAAYITDDFNLPSPNAPPPPLPTVTDNKVDTSIEAPPCPPRPSKSNSSSKISSDNFKEQNFKDYNDLTWPECSFQNGFNDEDFIKDSFGTFFSENTSLSPKDSVKSNAKDFTTAVGLKIHSDPFADDPFFRSSSNSQTAQKKTDVINKMENSSSLGKNVESSIVPNNFEKADNGFDPFAISNKKFEDYASRTRKNDSTTTESHNMESQSSANNNDPFGSGFPF